MMFHVKVAAEMGIKNLEIAKKLYKTAADAGIKVAIEALEKLK